MNYIQYTITCSDVDQSEIIIAELADMGFESFTEFSPDTNGFQAYIQKGLLTSSVNEYLAQSNIEYAAEEIPQQNWNAQWESNFNPIDVDGRCYIRATFHEPKPADYQIIITPKMSFGTGHHPTTHLMVEAILDNDYEGEQGLDMGSGTGILAILAVMRGAVQVDAVDIDEWAYENCIENMALNNVATAVCPILGDVASINGRYYDFILANINRNILLRDMPAYVETLKAGGSLTVSGILEFDVQAIVDKATELKLAHRRTTLREGWASIQFKK